MGSSRAWLFRGLLIVVAGLMVASWFMPWWSCWITSGYAQGYVWIHPWGLANNLVGGWEDYLSGSEMPAWFAPFMWAYLVICIALLLFSLVAREKAFRFGKFRLSLPQLLIGGVGLSYIVVVITAVIFAAIRTREFFGLHLIGHTHISVDPEHGGVGDAYAGLQLGYWLAWAVGALCIVLGLLRDKIIGKPNAGRERED
jgi:hypothetical protein